MPDWSKKAFKEWSTAVGNDPATRDAKFAALKAGIPSVANEMDLAKGTTELLQTLYANATAQEIGQFATWISDIMQWGNWNLDITRQIIARLHKKKSAAGDRTAERARVEAWLQKLYAEGGVAKQQINAFTNELSKKLTAPARIQMEPLLSPGFFSNAQVLVRLGGVNATNFPDWLPQAIEHRSLLPPGSVFWISTIDDEARIREIGDMLYANNDWKAPNAVGANEYASALAADATGRLGAMFPTLTRWIEVANEGAAKHIQDLPQKLIAIGQRRTVAFDQAILGNLGTWIWRNREAVLALVAANYSPQVIAKMHEKGLRHREIITTTWFRGVRANVDANANVVGFKMRNQANTDDLHGHFYGPTRHLAERHLYRYFQFNDVPEAPWDTPIKAQNSFHPHGTEQVDLANLRDHLKLPYQAPNRIENVPVTALGQNYMVAVDTEHNRVRTLYPRLQANHRDYYSEAQLRNIKDVAELFPNPYVNQLPEIAWFDDPRPGQP